MLRCGLEGPRREPEGYECPTFEMGVPLRSVDKALALADAIEEEEIARKLALRK